MTALVDPASVIVTAPGVYDIPNDAYQADPVPQGSLSASGARKLLPPSCPAVFAYERENPPPARRVFELGAAAHRLVLGDGPELVAIAADDWRSKGARDERDAIRAARKLPLLAEEYRQVQAMAGAIFDHPIAATLLRAGGGIPEASLFWPDRESGIWRRSRFDWLPDPGPGRLIIPEYKTADSANPDKWVRSAADYGYHQQDAWYRDAATGLGLGDDPVVVFIVQEKRPPYLVSPIQLDTVAVRIGQTLNRKAINLYAECTATGHWPAYTDNVAQVTLPPWYERQHLEDV